MKIAIINHGAPGSGMSTIAQAIRAELQLNNLRCTIHSTDAFFMINGIYVFQGNRLPEFHAQNLTDYKRSIDNGTDCVICDNTNLKQEHSLPYINYAHENGYLVILIHFHTDACNAHIARCPYVIPRSSMKKYIQLANDVYPVNALRIDVRPESFYQSFLSISKTIRKKLFGLS